MSGGSWNYVYNDIQDAADDLMHSDDALRRAFGKHLELCASAMHDIEWTDSGDNAKGSERETIEKALGLNVQQLVLDELLEEARNIVVKLQEYGV